MSDNESPRMHFAWPHAPVHRFTGPGAYMVTAGTRQKQPFFDTEQKLDLLLHSLFTYALDFDWQLQAWAILQNHYHFIAIAPDDPATLRKLISKLHTLTARALNQMDRAPGRKVWYQYWDSAISYDGSYFARLKYVHHNPEHHAVTAKAENYRWCSASWFERTAHRPFYKTVMAMKIDQVVVADAF